MNAIEAQLTAHYSAVRRRLMQPHRRQTTDRTKEIVAAQQRAKELAEKAKRDEYNKRRREAAARKRALLGPITPGARRSLGGIAREVSNKYGMTLADMRSKSRTRCHICCRAEWVKAVEFYLPYVSYADMGRFLHKDHTSILYLAGRLTAKKQPDCVLRLLKYLGTIYVTKTEFGGVYRGPISKQRMMDQQSGNEL